ncbi:polynucleotide kinase [Nocardia sp. NPDC049707]|uniref:phosphatase domain-containing protein n=1 Tax=Nocardia sp. NPDC049707 TaxID=3154735 RepID=UPI0034425584
MAKRYPIKDWKRVEPKFRLDIEPYRPPDIGPYAYIWDIDGTVAHMTGCSPYDYSRVSEDEPDPYVRALFWDIQEAQPMIRRLFVSGRSDDCRNVTAKWLPSKGFNSDELFMCKAGDDRDDAVVKLEIFNEHIRDNYNVLGVFDDRDRVVSMWRRLGLKCFQKASGGFLI